MKFRQVVFVILSSTFLMGIAVWVVNPKNIVDRASHELRRGWLLVTGRLIDVGGYRLHVERFGSGSPTVVMDAGLCQRMKSWGRVPSELAKVTRVVIYDRAGLGFSGIGPRPRTSQQNVNELHALLSNAGIAGPYILVGHSFGGLNVRLYASQYPAEVAGVVLIDASYERQYLRFASLKSAEERKAYLRHESGENCEKVNLIASGELVHMAPSLPSVPVVVLTADPLHAKKSSFDAKWAPLQMEMQSRLARTVAKGQQTIVSKSGHFIQLEQPEVVIDSIMTVVTAARNRPRMQSEVPRAGSMYEKETVQNRLATKPK
jgi:pimeloyl-ACP methyl ester carboxylesterase